MYRRGASVRPFDMHGYKRVGSLTRAGSRMQVAGAAGAFYGNPRQLGIQLAGIVTTMVFSFIMTLILIVPLDLVRACVRACVECVRVIVDPLVRMCSSSRSTRIVEAEVSLTGRAMLRACRF